jgi:putative transposase
MEHRYNPDIHHRRSVRLKGYDYAATGAYFIIICAYERECLFGEIVAGEMCPGEYGRVVLNEWLRTGENRQEVLLGECVVMPNHFHGILQVNDGATGTAGHDEGTVRDNKGTVRNNKGTARRAPTVEQFGKPIAGSLPTIIRSFKSSVTKCINEIRNSPGLSVWQRNYYEHVIRDEADYNRIAEYVTSNPQRWIEDKLHPNNYGTGNNANT